MNPRLLRPSLPVRLVPSQWEHHDGTSRPMTRAQRIAKAYSWLFGVPKPKLL
jgi:hypothetical protein